MPSHKAPGFSEVLADLFKQAPVSFQKRIHLLVNQILTGGHDCDTELLMTKVILIHKDMMMMIAFITFKSSLVPLFEGL